MNANEPRVMRVEVAADLPVLWGCLVRMGVVEVCERHLPAPPGWKGPLSPGQVVGVWLLYILSQSDHRLNRVEPWAQQHQGTLSALLGLPVKGKDFHDDRLADLLSRLGEGDLFSRLEAELNRHLVRTYDLPDEIVRLDTTTASTYQDVQSEDGLIQFGHSKDDPDRPQIKVACAALDPLGLPLATACLKGNTADDPTYIPAIKAVQQSLGPGDRLNIGDCKMAALATRVFVVKSKERYLCPLSESQLSKQERQELLKPVFTGEQPLEEVRRPSKKAGEPDELVAQGFSFEVQLKARAEGAQSDTEWTERRFLVRSLAFASAAEAALEGKLQEAEKALRQLPVRKQGKKQLFHRDLCRQAEAMVKEKGLEDLLDFRVKVVQTQKKVRAYKDKPERVETEVHFEVEVQRDEKAIKERKQEMGWQAYATNGKALSLEQVVWAYRGQYRVEDLWSRLKGRALCLVPLFLQDQTRIAGLVYLLSIALRVLTLTEHTVRKNLQKEKEPLRGLYAGQPGRKTQTPSTELILRAFGHVSLSVIWIGGQVHVLLTPLSTLQKRLLKLLDLPPDLFDLLARQFPIPPPESSEP